MTTGRPGPTPANPDASGKTPGSGALEPATRWALAARDGDPVAEAAFIRQTQAELWRYAAAMVDPEAADDLVQETYLRAFRALPTFQARASARTWLISIARRVCADHLRSVTRRRRLDTALRTLVVTARGTTPDPAGAVSAQDLLDRLPPQRRAAFVLTQVLGFSYEEAAAVEGVPVGTIRSRVARARDTLLNAIAPPARHSASG